MIKKIIERIWRTFIIVINTVMNIMFTLVTVVALFTGEQTWDSNSQVWPCLMMLLIINLIDYITRKNIRNY